MSKDKKSSFSEKFDTIASWYVPDENGHVNRPAQILFHGLCFLPIVIFEGIKVGIYHSFAPHNMNGFFILGKGLLTPFISVLKMKSTAAFGHSLNGQFAPQYVLIMFALYFTVMMRLYVDADRRKNLSNKKDGDIKFASLKEYNKELAYPLGEPGYSEPDEDELDANKAGNMIISKNARFSLAGTPNLYSCVWVQGSIGSGKSFTYVKPNILQMNASYVVTDPSCELITSLGTCLMKHGYDIKLFNLKRGEHQFSCRYNPFAYIHDEQDVILTVDAFLDATTDEGGNGGDPFFPIAEKNFYYALFYYIFTTLPKDKQTLKSVFELYLEADESDKPMQKPKSKKEMDAMSEAEKQKMAEAAENAFDKKFKDLARKDPYNPCLAFYKTFKNGSPKTKQSILISVGVKMWFLSVGPTANLLSGDDLNLERIGDRRTALFVAIPTDNASFKCISAMMFTQLFQTLYYFGDTVNNNSYLLKKGNCVAVRSDMFKPGSQSEEAEFNKINALKNIYMDAFTVDENELRKTDKALDERLSTPNKDGDYPWPKSYILVDAEKHPELDSEMFKDSDGALKYKKTEDGNNWILETFNSIYTADYVLKAAKEGEVKRGGLGHINRIRFILDEFFAIGKIADFDAKIATFRKYKISADIITQSKSQLAEMYDDKEGKIIGNCDIKICLGANDLDDAKFFSDICGQTTVRSESVSLDHKGGTLANASGGSISDNAQMLVRPEWILAQMKGDTALVFTRTKGPFKDHKYIAAEHPRWKEAYNDHDEEDTGHLRFEYRKMFCIEQKLDNRVKVNFLDDEDTAYLASKENSAVKGVSKDELLEKHKKMYRPAMPGIERHVAKAHPTASEIFANYVDNMKGKTMGEFNKMVAEEYSFAMDNKGRIPGSVLPADLKQRFEEALKTNTPEFKVDEEKKEIDLNEDFLGDIMNQVVNLH